MCIIINYETNNKIPSPGTPVITHDHAIIMGHFAFINQYILQLLSLPPNIVANRYTVGPLTLGSAFAIVLLIA